MPPPRECFTAAQCRAARGLLNWTVEQLANVAGLECEAIELYESGQGELAESELSILGFVLNRAGVIAISACLAGEGVRLRERRWPNPGERRSPPSPRDAPDDFDLWPQHRAADQVRRLVSQLAMVLRAPFLARARA